MRSGDLRHISGCGAPTPSRRRIRCARSSHRSRYRTTRRKTGIATDGAQSAMIAECQISRISTASPTRISACRRNVAFGACKEITMCAVVLNEIPRLVIEYPLAFTKNGETGQYICVALFGVDPDRNLYWQDERWNSVTVAAQCRPAAAFSSASRTTRLPAKAQKGLVTCIDLENPGVQTSAGEPLFDANGGETPYLRHKLALACGAVRRRTRSRAFADRLAALDLHPADSARAQGTGPPSRARSAGLYSIDEKKLRALDGATLAELQCARLPARDVRDVVVARPPADPRAPRRVQRTASGPVLKGLEAKEKAPATFVTGASLLGPWQ